MVPCERITLLQHPGSFQRGDRPTPKPTLTTIDTSRTKKKSFFPGFHSFSYGMQTQCGGQRNDAAQHSTRGLVRKDRINSRMINFENIKIETDDLHQAAVSGAKIIDRHAHSRSPGAVQRRASQSRESLPLRHFARNSAQMRRKLQLLDQPQNLAASQYHGGNIDAD